MLWGRSTGYLKPFFASDFFSMFCFFGLELQLLRVAWLPERRWVHGGDRKHVSAMGLWLILLGAGLSGVEFHSFNLGTRTHTSSLFHLLKFKNYWRFTWLWKCQNRTGTEMLPMVLHCLTPADFSCVRTSLSIIPSKKKVGMEKTVEKVLLIGRLPSFIKETGVVRPGAVRLSLILEFPWGHPAVQVTVLSQVSRDMKSVWLTL